ncbi:MAG: hypothetical protein IPI33_02700 [Dehalococcoidia bacterium]|nr:hypothetical protein [Dehalococcoidia bacterium]
MSGTATFVLHTHRPYCRLAGRWPHGEEWIHEALLECYLPLIGAFRRLSKTVDGSLGVTINITPILAEQLRDPLVVQHFREYLADRIGRAERDTHRFTTGPRADTARFHLARYTEVQPLFEDDLRGNVLGAFAALEDSGSIEIASCAATHGYLPLLADDDAVRFQIETGVQSHVGNFGRPPRSFWLPECAYRPGLERFLEDAGIRAFFVETHLVTGGTARGKALGGMVGPLPAPGQLPGARRSAGADRHDIPRLPGGPVAGERHRTERADRPPGLVGERMDTRATRGTANSTRRTGERPALLARHGARDRPGREGRVRTGAGIGCRPTPGIPLPRSPEAGALCFPEWRRGTRKPRLFLRYGALRALVARRCRVARSSHLARGEGPGRDARDCRGSSQGRPSERVDRPSRRFLGGRRRPPHVVE